MDIKCKKCGFENEHISIFCRECGEKLAKDQIDHALEHIKKRHLFTMIRIYHISFVIVVGVVLFLIFLVMYPSFISVKKTNGAKLAKAMSKLHALELQIHSYYDFSANEATMLYNEYLTSRHLVNTPLNIMINADKTITFLIRKKIVEHVPFLVVFSITGFPLFDDPEESNMVTGFTIKTIRLGNLPLPKFLGGFVVQHFASYYTQKTKNLLDALNVSKIDKSSGFTVYPKKEKTW